MAAGLGLLGLSPRAFWNATPKEIAAALRGRFGEAAFETPITRRELSDLMQKFPDRAPA